jgi:putative iron-dependent peroxidase
MQSVQPGILADETRLARYLVFSIASAEDIATCLQDLTATIDARSTVIGCGQSLVNSLGKLCVGLHTMPSQAANGIDVPSTPMALWCWLRGTDRGELFHRSRLIEDLLMPAFVLEDVVDSFQYDNNHDLTGYEDGTENPQGDAAVNAAIVQGIGAGMDGSTYVAVQQWLHDFDVFDDMSTEQQDNTIGRHISDNEEFDEAPESAHVKRAAQESFEPQAFMLRRSMPWAEGDSGGLMFVAFAKSLDAFEAIFNRMLGKEDGIRDALFNFTQPITGAYFWCPPVKDGRLDFSVLGIQAAE